MLKMLFFWEMSALSLILYSFPYSDFSNGTVSLCHTYNADTAGLHWKAHLECPGGHSNTWEASDTVAPDSRSTPVLNLMMTLFILLTGCRFQTVQVK